ncbi:MAG: lytic transglycosylase domain-containing protein [Thermoanaerobaculia bacterium]
MPRKKRSITESLSVRSAKARRKAQSHRLLRWIGGRGLATLALGAALSVGGVTEAFQGTHFLIDGDHHAMRAAKKSQTKHAAASVAANVIAPAQSFFDASWLPAVESPQGAQEPQPNDVFHSEMERINGAIRREFFANAVPFGDIIHDKAQKYDVDPALVAAVMETESRFRTKARSQVGARGLMQLMPRTGRWLGARNLYNAEQNVDAGAKYLKYLNARFDGNLTKTIAAYNAGEGNVRRYNGVPPFRETRSYVKNVMSRYEKRKKELKRFDDQHSAGLIAEDGVMTLR